MKRAKERLKLLLLLLALVLLPSNVFALENDSPDQGERLEIEGEEAEELDIRDLDSGDPDQVPDFQESPINPEFNRQKSARDEKNYGLMVDPLKVNTNYDLLYETKSQKAQYLPTAYDLRNYNRVSPVKDQGPNGSCWAFATYGSAESVLLPRELNDFSEKNMRNTHGYDWTPDQGGTAQVAAAYLARWSGPIAEADEPYSPYDFNSPSGLRPVKELKEALYIPDVRNGHDMDILKRSIMDYGAAYTTISANQSYTNMYNMSHYNPGRGYADHAVTIIGWDDNYSRNNFGITPPGDGAWLVKNSWGPYWGTQGGYYHVSYYDAHVGKNNCIFVLGNKNYSKGIWQHDPLGMTSNIGNGPTGWFSNVFGPVDRDCQVTEVGVFVPSNNTDYEIYMNTSLGNGSGFNDRVLVASGTIDYAGYQTIKIKAQRIGRGQLFAPIVKFTTRGYSYPIPIEEPIWGYSSRASAGQGQSYVSYDGYNWQDLSYSRRNTNVCVKAFTQPVGYNPDPEPDPEPDPQPDPGPDPGSQEVKVERLELNKTSLTLQAGQTSRIYAKIYPYNASNKEVIYSSSDPSIATVSSSGQIKALRSGRVTITAKAGDGSGAQDELSLEVSSSGQENPFLVETKLSKKNVAEGENLKVYVNVKDKYNRNLRMARVDLNIDGRDDASTYLYTNSYGNIDCTFYPRALGGRGDHRVNIRVSGYSYDDLIDSYDFTVGEDIDSQPEPEPEPDPTPEPDKESMDLDLSVYPKEIEPGDTVKISMQLGSTLAIGGADLNLAITSPDGENIEKTLTSNNFGKSYFHYSPQGGPGEYKVKVLASKEGYEDQEELTSFIVREKEEAPEKLNMIFKPDKKIYKYGERADINIGLYDSSNKQIKDEKLAIHVSGPGEFSYDIEKTTDYRGLCSMYLMPNEDMQPGLYKITISPTSGAYKGFSKTYRLNFVDPNKNPILMWIEADENYQSKTRAKNLVYVKDQNLNNLRDAQCQVELIDEEGRVLETLPARSNYTGKLTYTTGYLKPGDYTIRVKAEKYGYSPALDEIDFTIEK